MIEPKKIIYTKRKSIALVVNSEGDLIVRAPLIVSHAEVMEFVKKKQNWIKKKCSDVKVFDEKHNPITIADGETAIYLGNNYMIEVSDVDQITIDGNTILFPINNNSKESLKDWLKERALSLFIERIERYSKIMGVEPKEVKITEAKTRWGSCSQNNNLNFAWRLVMCPISVIDYVVVHELSHIAYKNHSKEFWIRVKTILPNYKEQQEWLDKNKGLMLIL